MFTKNITPNSSDSHQTSPAYVLTIVRWSNRDTLNSPNSDAIETRNPLVVYNDAINVQVNATKSMSTNMAATLANGDLNYATAISPGDYILVNMVNWQTKAEEIRNRAVLGQQINKLDDGFKGLFKIQTVTKNLITQPNGTKTFFTQITAAGFTELNTVIVYNPALQKQFEQDAKAFYQALLGDYYSDQALVIKNAGELITDLYAILVGPSHRDDKPNVKDYGNTHYKLPTLVSSLLGIPSAKYVNEAYNLITGTWEASASANASDNVGFNPSISPINSKNNVFKTNTKLQGTLQLLPQDWNQKSINSILQAHLNGVVNEMYVCYRTHPTNNSVMPTIIARQKPFTNPNFEWPSDVQEKVPLSKFMDLPRWKLAPELVKSFNLYKNEQLRVNFVQIFTRNYSNVNDVNLDMQIAYKNFQIDKGDIERSGLRPYIQTSDMDYPTSEDKKSPTNTLAKTWTHLVADWVINGHLKECGTFTCVGLQDNICVGDNLEFDGIVYHIEGVNHVFQVNPNGIKTFQTVISVSYGIDARSDSSNLYFTEMEYTDRLTRSQEDYKNNQLLPGFSDTQDIMGRVNGEEIKKTQEKPFQKPNKPRIK